MDEKERGLLWGAIGALAAAVIAEGVIIYLQGKDLKLVGAVLVKHVDDAFQEEVDEEFENIVDRFDD